MKIKDRFCGFCGAKMNIEAIPAEEAIDSDKFDSKTGLRNYILKFTCPNFKLEKSGFFRISSVPNGHNNYIVGDIVHKTNEKVEEAK